MECNGWKNYNTWNVAMWLGADQGLYNLTKAYNTKNSTYDDFIFDTGLAYEKTGDGVSFNAKDLDREALTEFLQDK